jgi:hypothetical protein
MIPNRDDLMCHISNAEAICHQSKPQVIVFGHLAAAITTGMLDVGGSECDGRMQ